MVKGFLFIYKIMKSNPQVSLFKINSIEVINAPRKSG